MRTLLVGALAANLVGCSHQLPPAQTAADSCASRNPLACFMSVQVSLRSTSRTTTAATLQSKPVIARQARAAAASLGTATKGRRREAKNLAGEPRHSSLMAAW
jgi:hypothetical protein